MKEIIKTLSVATPAYNEGANLQSTLLHWYDYLKNNTTFSKIEIIVANDGSTDNSKSILDALHAQIPDINVIHLAKNQGAAAALAQAIKATTGDLVLLTDADDQFPIENLSQMLDAFTKDHAKACIGIRNKQDHAWARLGSKASGLICNLTHRAKLRDFNSAFKLIDGNLLRDLHLEARGMNYSTEITSRLLERRVPIVEVEITHKARKIGASHLKLFRDSVHRALFVAYLSLRQLLLRVGILRRFS